MRNSQQGHVQSSTGSGEGETEAAWVMAVAWAVADGVLAGSRSCCERAALLARLTTLDLPVPHGSGAARYGSALCPSTDSV